ACSLPFVLCSSQPATTELYTLSLHDALPISTEIERFYQTQCLSDSVRGRGRRPHAAHTVIAIGHANRLTLARLIPREIGARDVRSEEHTSELQSRENLVCRLLLEKKKRKKKT